MPRRTLRSAAVALAAVLAAVLAFGLLAAPAASAAPTSRQPLPGLHAEARVLRDGRGIPHVVASNAHDLYFMQGWVHAEDRLFQMDLLRRQASGTLAELLGPNALASDVELRTIGLRRAAERSVPALSAAAQADLAAYAEGVDAWVASHPLPVEYGLLELTAFAPWTPADSVVIAKLLAFSLSFDLDVNPTVTFSSYVQAGTVAGFDGAALFFEDLVRSAPFDPASTVPDATDGAGNGAPVEIAASAGERRARFAAAAAAARALSPATLELARGYLDRVAEVPLLRAAAAPRERAAGSNEWAIAGRHTASGRPLIANDPHLGLDVPAIFHQIHLRAPAIGVDVMGSGFAGVPYVVLGQNRYVAWGATTNPLDVTDTYQEAIVVDPTSPSGLSTVFQGTQEPVIPIPEVFRVNPLDGTPDNLTVMPPGGAIPPATLIVPRRNQGPIVALDAASGTALSVQYAGFSATRELDTFRIWNAARGLADFRAGLDLFDVGSQNWVYGDVDGNIAYFTSAEMPLREDLQANTVDGLPPFFIRDGTGGNEWIPAGPGRPVHHAIPYQILPYEEMPQLVNPPDGYFVNANNDPAGTTLDNDPLNQLRPGGGLYYLNYGYAQGTRAGRITQLVHQAVAAGGVTSQDMQRMQADVVLLDAQVFVPHIVAAWDAVAPLILPADPRLPEAVERLRHWDGSTPTGLARGFDAADPPGTRLVPEQAEIDASVAATIYSVWRGRMIGNTVDLPVDALGLPRPGSREAIIALRHLLDSFDQDQGIGASGIDFFPEPAAVADREQRRDLVILQSLQEALDLLAGPAFAPAFDGSTDLDAYRWGRLHRIVFDHPFGPPFSIPPGPDHPLGLDLGAADLPGVPVDGGFGVVDASSHSARADSANEFMFGSGPVRRYVGELGRSPGGTDAVTALPGGESGDPFSPFFANLLPLWLTNDAYPVVQRFGELQQAVAERQIFTP